MLYLAAKALLSGGIIALASEVSKRAPGLGALIVSLPMVSVLAMIWLWHDTQDPDRVASHAEATLWLVLPSLPMFVLLPWLLRHGTGFWLALGASAALTTALYLAMVTILARYGIRF